MTMTKLELVTTIARQHDISRDKASAILDDITALWVTALEETGEAKIQNIGTLKLAQRAARPGKNPATGEPIQIPAAIVVKLTTTKTLKERLNP
ncbi:HU family DNA-binding protein [Salmonella enterica subsp. enterica serovar Mississippi]|nr:HU family DNA-binding protein [Salmonella enterica subsp. enterica serovar Mississippi]